MTRRHWRKRDLTKNENFDVIEKVALFKITVAPTLCRATTRANISANETRHPSADSSSSGSWSTLATVISSGSSSTFRFASKSSRLLKAEMAALKSLMSTDIKIRFCHTFEFSWFNFKLSYNCVIKVIH